MELSVFVQRFSFQTWVKDVLLLSPRTPDKKNMIESECVYIEHEGGGHDISDVT